MRRSVQVFIVLLAAVMVPRFALAWHWESKGCEIRSNLGNHDRACLVINEPYKFVGSNKEVENYKADCTLSNIVQSINDDQGYCNVNSYYDVDPADASNALESGNLIVFQPKIDHDGYEFNSASTETKIDGTDPSNLVSILLKDEQNVFLSGLVVPTWGQYFYTPFDHQECHGLACPDLTISLTLTEPDKDFAHSNHKAEISLENIPRGLAGISADGIGMVVFKNIDVKAHDCGGGLCGHMFGISGNAKMVFERSKIWSQSGTYFVFDVKNEENKKFSDYLSFKETTIETGAPLFKFRNPIFMTPADFIDLEIKREHFYDLMMVDGLKPAVCFMNPDRKSCTIDPSTPLFYSYGTHESGLLRSGFSTVYDHWFYIDENGKFQWRQISSSSWEGHTVLNLDKGDLHKEYWTMTNMGQVIQVVEQKNSAQSFTAHYDNTITTELKPISNNSGTDDAPSSDDSDVPASDGDSSTHASDDTLVDSGKADDSVDFDDGNTAGGEWYAGEANVDGALSETNESASGSFGCSLATTATGASSPLCLLIVLLPLSAILWRRAGH